MQGKKASKKSQHAFALDPKIDYSVIVGVGEALQVVGSALRVKLRISSLAKVPRVLISTRPALVSGPAACGKSSPRMHRTKLCPTRVLPRGS